MIKAEALFPERLYLATPRPGGVSHPPAQQEEQRLYPDKSHANPTGRQAPQPKAQLRLREAQGHVRKKRARLVWMKS
jgi:hypothetical protein